MSEFKLDGSLKEQVEKAHEIIGDVASGLRTFRKSIPAGSQINTTPCYDEDLYLGQVIGNLWNELVKHVPMSTLTLAPNDAGFIPLKSMRNLTRDEVIEVLASSRVKNVYREFSKAPISVQKIVDEHATWRGDYKHALEHRAYAIVIISEDSDDFVAVEYYGNGYGSIICSTIPCKMNGSNVVKL